MKNDHRTLPGVPEKGPRPGMVLFLICCLAFVLRIINLAGYDLQYDELFFLLKVKPGELFGLSSNYYHTRPVYLYNLFLNYWQGLGSDPFILRFSSVVFGVCSVAMMYLLAKTIFGRRIGLVSAFLLAVSPFHICYSQELSLSSPVILLTISSFYFFMKLLQRERLSIFAGYVLCTALNVYLSYFSVFVILAQAGVRIFYMREKTFRIRNWVAAGTILACLLIPFFHILSIQAARTGYFMRMSSSKFSLTPFNTSVSAVNAFYTFKNLSTGYYSSAALRTAGFVAMVCLFLYGILTLFRKDKRKAAMVSVFLFFPMAALVLISLFVLVYSDRYIFSSMVFFYCIVAYSIDTMGRRFIFLILGLLSVIAVCALSDYYSNRSAAPFYERAGVNTRKGFRNAVDYLKANFREGDILIHISESSTLPFEYYYNRDSVRPFTGGGRGLRISMSGMAGFVEDYFFRYRSFPKIAVHDIIRHTLSMHRLDAGPEGPESGNTPFWAEGYKRIWLVCSYWDGWNAPGLVELVHKHLGGYFVPAGHRKIDAVDLFLYTQE